MDEFDDDEIENVSTSNKNVLLTVPENNNKLTYSISQFIPKVVIEKYYSARDVMYLLKTSLEENNFPEDYKIIDNDENKFIVEFDNDNAAMCFTKKLNLEKMKNPSYKETIITLTLIPNHNYQDRKVKKKKGLPLDSIERLFRGESLLNKGKTNKSKLKNTKKLYMSRDFPNFQNDVKGNFNFFIL